jgi:hypothetical protein
MARSPYVAISVLFVICLTLPLGKLLEWSEGDTEDDPVGPMTPGPPREKQAGNDRVVHVGKEAAPKDEWPRRTRRSTMGASPTDGTTTPKTTPASSKRPLTTGSDNVAAMHG